MLARLRQFLGHERDHVDIVATINYEPKGDVRRGEAAASQDGQAPEVQNFASPNSSRTTSTQSASCSTDCTGCYICQPSDNVQRYSSTRTDLPTLTPAGAVDSSASQSAAEQSPSFPSSASAPVHVSGGKHGHCASLSMQLSADNCGLDGSGGSTLGPKAAFEPAASGTTATTSTSCAPSMPCMQQPQLELVASTATVRETTCTSAGGVALWAFTRRAPPAMQRAEWSLADYTINVRLYKGSYSSVYQATCLRSGMPVVLKVYYCSRVPDNVMHMVLRERAIHATQEHRNIVRLYAAFQDAKHLVMVQEWASRGDLYSLRRRLAAPLTERQVAGLVVRPLLRGLAHLHARGICHRDIKPENILLTEEWCLKLADFGVSIDLAQERAVTRSGTHAYMSPEVARCPLKHRADDNKNDPSLCYGVPADIYSLGLVVLELLTGKSIAVLNPPPAADQAHTGARRKGADPRVTADADGAGLRELAAAARGLPAEAANFVLQCLAHVPHDRPTAKQLLAHPWLAF